jgi:hypothetical protein
VAMGETRERVDGRDGWCGGGRTLTAHSHTRAPTLCIQIQGKEGKSGEGWIQIAEGESAVG